MVVCGRVCAINETYEIKSSRARTQGEEQQ